jgi:hypothetical protein
MTEPADLGFATPPFRQKQRCSPCGAASQRQWLDELKRRLSRRGSEE